MEIQRPGYRVYVFTIIDTVCKNEVFYVFVMNCCLQSGISRPGAYDVAGPRFLPLIVPFGHDLQISPVSYS